MRVFLRNALDSTRLRRKTVTENPSVLDFQTTKDLQTALDSDNSVSPTGSVVSKKSKKENAYQSDDEVSVPSARSIVSIISRKSKRSVRSSNTRATAKSASPSKTVEWKLTKYDEKETEPQSMEQEMKRLQVLQSYLLLDSNAETDFDRITGMCSKVFNVPIAVISLVDLGRQWFMSTHGLDAKETPRKHAFCAHVILNVKNILVVNDASKDPRFMNNPLVTGPPNIRFYAGAALVSPEGYKLGTVCIIDSQPRVFNKSQQETLRDFAAMAMSSMVDRRERLLNQDAAQAKLLAHTCVDVCNSLKTMHKTLKTLEEQTGASMNELQRRALNSVMEEAQLKMRTCQSAIRTCKASTTASIDIPSAEEQITEKPKRKVGMDDLLAEFEQLYEDDTAVARLEEVLKNLNSIIAPLPNKVPIKIETDSTVPTKIIGDELLIFRCALNLVYNSLERTRTGNINFHIGVDEEELIIECEDTGPEVKDAVDQKNYFLKSNNHLLQGISSMVSSMGGECGARLSESDNESTVYWFSIPMIVANDLTSWSGESTFGSPQVTVHEPKTSDVHFVKTFLKNGSTSNQKTDILVNDPFQAAVIENSCFSAALRPSVAARVAL